MVGMVLVVVQRRACASSAEQMATTVASQWLRCTRVEQMEHGRSRGERGRDEALSGPMWLDRAVQRRRVAIPRGVQSLTAVGTVARHQRTNQSTDSENCRPPIS